MASLTQWTWVSANSGRRWRTGKPGMLQSAGSQRVRHEWVAEQQQSVKLKALESTTTNKASGGDGIPAELFKILKKIILWKCWTQYASTFGLLSSVHRTGKSQFSFQSQRRAMPKNVQTTVQLCSFHMVARLCSKSFKLGFSSMWTKNFQSTSWI